MKIQFLLLPVILGCKNPVDIVTDIHREVNNAVYRPIAETVTDIHREVNDAVYRPIKENVIDPVIDPIDDAIFDQSMMQLELMHLDLINLVVLDPPLRTS